MTPCCQARASTAVALVAMEPMSVHVDMADLVVDWGDARLPVILAFRFCPWCGAEQDVDAQAEAWRRRAE